MNSEDIILNKQKIKKIVLISALCILIVACAAWIIAANPFLGFGYHDFGEQLFTLILEILVPPVLMAATDCLTTVLFKKRFIALIIAETVLMCVKRCLSYLSCLSGADILGVNSAAEPVKAAALVAVLYAAFFLILFFAYILTSKAVKKTHK